MGGRPNQLTSPLEGEVETAGNRPGVEGGGDMDIPFLADLRFMFSPSS